MGCSLLTEFPRTQEEIDIFSIFDFIESKWVLYGILWCFEDRSGRCVDAEMSGYGLHFETVESSGKELTYAWSWVGNNRIHVKYLEALPICLQFQSFLYILSPTTLYICYVVIMCE